MSLTTMAEALLAQAKELDTYLEANSIPYPTIDDDTLAKLPSKLQETRQGLVNATEDFKKIVQGPLMTALNLIFAWTDALPFRIIYHFKLAHAVPLHSTTSYTDIATCSGLSEQWCFRAIRAAIGNNIFDEDKATGGVQHTAISRMLVTDQGFADAVGLQLSELGPAGSKLIDVLEKHAQDTGDPTRSAFSIYNATDKDLFGVLARDNERARRFGSAMNFFTAGASWDLSYLLVSIDWSCLDKEGTVIADIGGGYGQISLYLARHTKHVRFVVQDLKHVTSAASAALPAEFSDRVEFIEHSFFTPQNMWSEPPSAFFLRWILHDWNDVDCVRILKALAPAMRKGSKVLIYEYVLEDDMVKSSSGRFGLQSDMVMAIVCNSQERYKRDFQRLLENSHESFVLEGIRRPEGSMMSLLEVGWKG